MKQLNDKDIEELMLCPYSFTQIHDIALSNFPSSIQTQKILCSPISILHRSHNIKIHANKICHKN